MGDQTSARSLASFSSLRGSRNNARADRRTASRPKKTLLPPHFAHVIFRCLTCPRMRSSLWSFVSLTWSALAGLEFRRPRYVSSLTHWYCDWLCTRSSRSPRRCIGATHAGQQAGSRAWARLVLPRVCRRLPRFGLGLAVFRSCKDRNLSGSCTLRNFRARLAVLPRRVEREHRRRLCDTQCFSPVSSPITTQSYRVGEDVAHTAHVCSASCATGVRTGDSRRPHVGAPFDASGDAMDVAFLGYHTLRVGHE